MKCPKCNFDNPDTLKFCGECGLQLDCADSMPAFPTKTLETPIKELTRGTLFANRYEIIEELGRGGMGSVFRVEDTKINEDVALKLIKPEIASDRKTIERFNNELKTARKIAHRNVCKMFDLGEDRGTHYITMEYVSGGDLKKLIRRTKRLDTGTVISIAKQICQGLVEAHSLGIVHRDLKPNNIMIDDNGNARIMDFGIARSISEKGITGAGVMIGTPEYMSPEQVEAKDIDHRSDIYSLGIILYELITGRLPFEADTPFAMGVKHKSETPKDPKEFNPQMPDALSEMILKCLEKEKENRYQSAEEVLSELENIETGIPTTERAIPKRKTITSKEITVSFSVKRYFIPILAFVALIVIGLIIWRPWSKETAIPIVAGKPSLAVVYFENHTGDENLEHWSKALCELLIADLTQSKYIRVLSSDRLIDVLSGLDQIDASSFSSSVLQQIATRGGSSYILRGSYTKAGDQFRIDAILQEAATMESIGSDRIEGRGEESFLSMVDELTRKVKAHFQLSEEEIAKDIDNDIKNITTSSPEALKYYIEGRKYHLIGDYYQSIEIMEKAITSDPEFAMAYRSIAAAYGNIGFTPQRKEYMAKALELSDRLPEKERYMIEGDFYSDSEKTYDKAIEAYKRLLELYPDNGSGNHNLARIYSYTGEKQKAIEFYEINRTNDVLSLIGYANLASIYHDVDAYDKAREVLVEALQKYPNTGAAHRDLALHYKMEGKYDLALAELSKAFALEPTVRHNFRIRAMIYYYQGDLDKAVEDYKWLSNHERPQAWYVGSLGLANINISQGKLKEAKDILMPLFIKFRESGIHWTKSEYNLRFAYIDLKKNDLQEALKESDIAAEFALKADDSDRMSQALHLKGLIYLRMNSIEDSLKTAEDLRVFTDDSPDPQFKHFYHHLNGMIELKQNNFSEAIELFKQALNLQSLDPRNKRADYIESLASAYYASGDIDKARAEYERITSSLTVRLNFGDVYAKSFYMLGKIYEQQDNTAKAIENYERFLDLWKDADQGAVEVADARARVAALKG